MEAFFKNHKHGHIFHDIQNNTKLSNNEKINHANMLRMCIELLGYGRSLTNYEDKINLQIINLDTENYTEITNNNIRWTKLLEYKEYANTQMNQSLYSDLIYDCEEIKNYYYSHFEKYVK